MGDIIQSDILMHAILYFRLIRLNSPAFAPSERELTLLSYQQRRLQPLLHRPKVFSFTENPSISSNLSPNFLLPLTFAMAPTLPLRTCLTNCQTGWWS
ncbi:hypothetical protein BCR35DRAFT_101694 [Leucosporidium creatinivorum]|uniref:Uncharacterized protein n=1 Tax=Leucosporidium creatinivorum TaxID=106004 RepID=A0A1Y2F4J5_9BASI|nr:hypothetical protein BCR35DRAFT_101694 [Leucosporidium creatinivorum]